MAWRIKRDKVNAEPEGAAAGVEPEPVPDPFEEAVAEAVAGRLAELTHREAALRRLTEAVEKQRTRLEERERELAEAGPSPAEVERVAHAERRAEEADARATEADRRAEEAARRAQQLEERIAELATRLEAAEAAPAVVAEEPEPSVAGGGEAATAYGPYTLPRLEQLLREAEQSGDPQAEEWAYYLPLLREHAGPDGRLPAQFDSLVDSLFGVA